MHRDLVESCYRPAALKALGSFPVEAENVELIAHSENVTFRVSIRGSDTDFVLRLHRPGYNSIEELNSERIWTNALKEAGVSVQDSLLTRQGQHFELIDIRGAGEQRYAGMTTWLEGTLLSEYLATSSDREERKRIFRRIGGIAAAIHNQSTLWKVPPGFKRRRLDLDGLLGEAPRWGRFWEHAELTKAEKESLLRARERARAALLEGYGEHRQLSGRDVEMLSAFLLIRGMAIIGWFHQRPVHAGSGYFEEVKNWVIGECDSNER